ncbi:hypothetical protein, partial [Limosilactobacillus reuteri]|uniref:hypothetical protein n=1 Tax=Limosilactobacillus reuteri TaxID=1598 RepID=UPI003CFDCE96
MTKNIKKNTKLALTVAAVAATTVATGAIATTAHADQVSTNTNTNTQTKQGQSDLKTAQDQSRQNYADAKSAN